MALQDNALLTLAELKAGLKITQADQDSVLETFINATSDALETQTGRRLKTRAYANEYLYVQADHVRGIEWLEVEWPITALTALSIDGTAQTLWLPGDSGDPDDKDVFVLAGADPKHGRDRLYRPGGWTPGALVKRSYEGGYGASTPANMPPLPEELKQMCIILARDWYYLQTRQAQPIQSRSIEGEAVTYVNEALPRQFKALIASYRRWNV